MVWGGIPPKAHVLKDMVPSLGTPAYVYEVSNTLRLNVLDDFTQKC
jgi:hypothetical protein